MELTKDFRETIRERARREPAFREALLREAAELTLSGDKVTGRAILKYVALPLISADETGPIQPVTGADVDEMLSED